jgi:regulator of protease activity HflC (stomatin/prohibitin superfamily)
MLEGLGILVLAIVAVVLFYLLRAIRMVPQGYNYTVERFGKYVRTLEPGLGLIIPFIDRIGAKQNMMEQVLDIPSQEVITRDNAMVKVDGVTFYQIVDAPRAIGRSNNPAPSGDCIRVVDSAALAQGNDASAESGTSESSPEDSGQGHELVHELVENRCRDVEVIA